MTNPHWIFFDLGWTLVDESRAHRPRFERVIDVLAGLGRQASIQELEQLYIKASTDFAPQSFGGMLERLGLTEEQRSIASKAVRYAKENETLFPGVPELLRTLSKKCTLGVIANQSSGTEQRLREWGIRDYFTLVFSSAEFGLEKPDPKIFEAALAEAGCTPDQAMMVGDRLDNDIGPAKHQGWHTVRVLQGYYRYQKPGTAEEVPDTEIANINEFAINKTVNLLR